MKVTRRDFLHTVKGAISLATGGGDVLNKLVTPEIPNPIPQGRPLKLETLEGAVALLTRSVSTDEFNLMSFPCTIERAANILKNEKPDYSEEDIQISINHAAIAEVANTAAKKLHLIFSKHFKKKYPELEAINWPHPLTVLELDLFFTLWNSNSTSYKYEEDKEKTLEYLLSIPMPIMRAKYERIVRRSLTFNTAGELVIEELKKKITNIKKPINLEYLDDRRPISIETPQGKIALKKYSPKIKDDNTIFPIERWKEIIDLHGLDYSNKQFKKNAKKVVAVELAAMVTELIFSEVSVLFKINKLKVKPYLFQMMLEHSVDFLRKKKITDFNENLKTKFLIALCEIPTERLLELLPEKIYTQEIKILEKQIEEAK